MTAEIGNQMARWKEKTWPEIKSEMRKIKMDEIERSGMTKPAGMSEIAKELHGLAKACENLLDTTHNLMDKAAPAMGPAMPSNDGGPVNPQATRSEIAGRISDRREQVEAATRIIKEVVNRLEI